MLGAVFGYLTIRRQGIYFAMITLAFAQMVYFFCVQAPFTGGEDGIQAVPRGYLFGFIDLNNTYVMYYFVLAVFLFGFWLIYRTIHSPFGQVMKAIRENEPRAISLGYRRRPYKLLAFVLSAALAGLAGAIKSLVFQFASLTDVLLDDVGRSGADDAARRHRHDLRPGGRRLYHRDDGDLPGADRLLGHDHPGRHLRGLRADLPRGHRRRHRAVHRWPAGSRRWDLEAPPADRSETPHKAPEAVGARSKPVSCASAMCAG